MEWISVEERLPKLIDPYGHSANVLVSNGRCSVDIDFYQADGCWYEQTMYQSDKITHWMPLPEPPE